MVRDSKRRDKALARKRKRREEKKSQHKAAQAARDAECSLKHAGVWPIAVSQVNANWRERQLATVALARKRPDRQFLLGMFLVDLGCLGVKNAIYDPALPASELAGLLTSLEAQEEMIDCSPELAAKIVAAGVDYAESLGFLPHPDYDRARVVLQGIDFTACPEAVACGGEDGKPMFVSGPDDDIEAVVSRLERKLGPDGFHFIIGHPDTLE